MTMDITKIIAAEFNITEQIALNIVNLIDEGATIPFISRYRKELTNSADDQMLQNFDDRLKSLRNLKQRKEDVEKLITEQGNMTPEILVALDAANTVTEVDDIYRPFRPKRKTRASEAIAKGLQPLADFILAQEATPPAAALADKAQEFINSEKGVNTAEEALKGARDICAEVMADSASARKRLRTLFYSQGEMETKFKEKKQTKAEKAAAKKVVNNANREDLEDELNKDKSFVYENYAAFKSPIRQLPSHRILAINRGENEDVLKVEIKMDTERALTILHDEFIKNNSPHEELLKEVAEDAFDRLLFESICREVRAELTDKANEQAIKMFETNLKPLLMQPPLRNKIILAIDPGYRTGCKVAVINQTGSVLDHTVIYPTPPHKRIPESEVKIASMVEKNAVDVIAIGNGTATKETEIFVADLIKKMKRKITYAVVNESGASVYSASKLGAAEFPQYDVTTRGAISLARRLADPLAELIKIDVKSIGVGQYQHDMPQKRLDEVLGNVVVSCVNSVGVDLNTASPQLLSFVSGFNKSIAESIVTWRDKKGKFKFIETLREVPKLGGKAFELGSGFLRITDGANILDNTGVHPESYEAAEKLLQHFNITKEDVKESAEKTARLPELVEKEGAGKVAAAIGIGEPTLHDIVTELLKPGRDVRDSLPMPVLRSDVMDIKDLKPGMVFDGAVRNVIDFGVFVDIGVHQDGLAHISQISNQFIKHPSEVLKVGDVVKAKILSVDLDKKRISLTLKNVEETAN